MQLAACYTACMLLLIFLSSRLVQYTNNEATCFVPSGLDTRTTGKHLMGHTGDVVVTGSFNNMIESILNQGRPLWLRITWPRCLLLSTTPHLRSVGMLFWSSLDTTLSPRIASYFTGNTSHPRYRILSSRNYEGLSRVVTDR